MKKNTLQEGVEMMEAFARFKSEQPDGNMHDFGAWLMHQEAAPQEHLAAKELKQMPDTAIEETVGWIWGRLMRFTRLWEREMFQQMPVHSGEEFGILLQVRFAKSPRKSDVIHGTLLEPTTCFEMIKRLVSRGWLTETKDEQDKRVRRLHLTKEGAKIVAEHYPRLIDLSKLLLGDLNPKQMQTLLDLLQQLDNFHQRRYEELVG